MRVAVVDIGTNSTRLLVADVDGDRVTDELERHSEVTRLGTGVDANGALDDEAMGRVYKTLDEYRELIDRHGGERCLAVLTSAVRDAANGQEFARTVEEGYRLEPHILTGDDEARLTFLGATSERDPDDPTPTLVVDIGGGSTEMVIGSSHEPTFHVSNQAGVVRQTERHLHGDPPTADEIQRAEADIRAALAEVAAEVPVGEAATLVGLAGSVTTVAAIALELPAYDAAAIHGSRIPVSAVRAVTAGLLTARRERRAAMPVMHPGRVDVIGAGSLVLRVVMDAFALDEVVVSEHDILDGIVLRLAGR
jgi:exopolyphosphatase/guanosine-5'-triphosphate,3'-diphosphate pyrophosphatase